MLLNKSVRPLLTISFAGAIIYLTVSGHMSPEFLQGVAAGTIAFWFGEKSALKRGPDDADD